MRLALMIFYISLKGESADRFQIQNIFPYQSIASLFVSAFSDIIT